jgi:hypothetical protein
MNRGPVMAPLSQRWDRQAEAWEWLKRSRIEPSMEVRLVTADLPGRLGAHWALQGPGQDEGMEPTAGYRALVNPAEGE